MKDTVNIAGHEYLINNVLELDNGDSIGEIENASLNINISSEIPNTRREQVLAHEILHGIFIESGYRNDQAQEELIEGIENIFYRFLKDNTDFYKTENTNKG